MYDLPVLFQNFTSPAPLLSALLYSLPPGIPPSNFQHHPEGGRGFQPYHQRANHHGRYWWCGGYVQGASNLSQFGGCGVLAYSGGRIDSYHNLEVNTPQKKLFCFSKRTCLPLPMEKEIYLKFQRSMKWFKILKYSKTQAQLRHWRMKEKRKLTFPRHKVSQVTCIRDFSNKRPWWPRKFLLPQAVAHFPHHSCEVELHASHIFLMDKVIENAGHTCTKAKLKFYHQINTRQCFLTAYTVTHILREVGREIFEQVVGHFTGKVDFDIAVRLVSTHPFSVISNVCGLIHNLL